MVPAILESTSGQFLMSLGGSGGSRIFSAVFQAILNVHAGMDVSAAVEAGRVHDQLFPLLVDVDDVVGLDMAEELKSRGHNVTVTDVNAVKAVVNAVMRRGEKIYGEFVLRDSDGLNLH